jgi:hypothetical protein
VVIQACHPNAWEAEARESGWRPAWATQRNCVSKNKQQTKKVKIKIKTTKTLLQEQSLDFSFSIFYSFIHMCISCLGHFSPLPTAPPSPTTPSHFQAELVLPLSLILLKSKHKQ